MEATIMLHLVGKQAKVSLRKGEPTAISGPYHYLVIRTEEDLGEVTVFLSAEQAREIARTITDGLAVRTLEAVA